jgi:hypothetical protein
MNHKVEIWATKGMPLRQSEWEKHRYNNLPEYVQALINSHEGHRKGDCKTCLKLDPLPLASFGMFDPNTGEKEVVMSCETEEDLPTESIPGILEFNSN